MTAMQSKIACGSLPPGPLNAITDVPGVRVGHVTIWQDAPLVKRTGITAIAPLAADYTEQSVFGGFHCFNGFGEFCGMHWLRETGVLTAPVLLTSSYSVGIARDAMMLDPVAKGVRTRFHHPCIGETNDAFLNGLGGGHLTAADVTQVLANMAGGPVAEGCVGGGTGMMAYGFKAGIGTASRIARTELGDFTVGVLVQSNHGRRKDLRFEGLPVGLHIGAGRVPDPHRAEDGSIIAVVATDAPLLPPQCNRLAQRAVIGIGRSGSPGHNSSGEFALVFSTANRLAALGGAIADGLRMFPNDRIISPLFEAAIEATEAAIVNSLLAAVTTEGAGGARVHALDRATLAAAIADARAPETGS